ncbi:MAG: hypothetical protein AVDCRST_MAG18-2122, partial [uncultured Thermomicrobiales bacterium]
RSPWAASPPASTPSSPPIPSASTSTIAWDDRSWPSRPSPSS